MVNEMTPEMRVNAFTERMPPIVLRWQGMMPDTDDLPTENMVSPVFSQGQRRTNCQR